MLIWTLDDVDAQTLAPMKTLRALPDSAKRVLPALALVRPQSRPTSASVHLLRLFDDIVEKPVLASEIVQRVAALLDSASAQHRSRTSGEG